MARSVRQQISDYINRTAPKGFKWGEQDCALWASNMLVEVFGMQDVGEKFRGKYNNNIGAIRTVKENGYIDIPDIARKHCKEISKPEIGALATWYDKQSLGICLGAYSYFLAHEGVVKVSSKTVERFWKCQQQSQQ